MAEIVAVFPLSAMSKMSASPSGQIRTRSPSRYSTPATRNRSIGGDSSQGFSVPMVVLSRSGRPCRGRSDRAKAPNRPVEPLELLLGERLGALEERPGPVVDLAHGPLL